MMVTVSVIIPVYNGAALVARAIDSALAQSLTPLEVIVVDDGSSDNTVEVLARYGPRIRTLHVPHGGVSRARNAGIAASRGELLAFLDADDIWHRNKLARQAAVLRAWPQAGLCCCDYLVQHGDHGGKVSHFGGALPLAGLAPDPPLISAPLPALIRCNFVGTASNVMLRRELALRAGGFDPQLRQAEDYDYWLRCAMLAPFVLLPTPLLEKRSHGANLTANMLETAQYHERVLLAWQDMTVLPAESRQLLIEALGQVCYRIARQLALRGEAGAALGYCVRGWRSERSAANWALAARTLARCLLHLMSRSRAVHP
jgi:glycosyltransferase involved in cell wall biosynthesis